MRHRAHRDERADRQVAGAEVRAGRPASEALAEERAQLRQRELRRARGRVAGLGDHARRAPAAARRAASASRGPVAVSASAASAIAVGPGGERSGVALSASSAAPQPRSTSSGNRPARSITPLSTSSSGSTPSEQPLAVLGHRDAQQQPVEAGVPRTGGHPHERVHAAVLGVEAPAGAAVGNPLLDAREVVVVEPEAAADGLAVGEVEHLRCRQPLLGELDQLRDDGEHGVRLAQRAVREADAEVGALRREVVVLGAGAERRLDQRRERLDVRAHHDHVARLERRILLEQMQDHVAQHLDLARATVTGVDLDASVVGRQRRTLVGRSGQRRTGRTGGQRGRSAWIRPRSVVGGDGDAWWVLERRRRARGRAPTASRASPGPRRPAAGWRPA